MPSVLLLSGGWGSISARDANRINKLIQKARSIIGQNVEAFESVSVRGH